MLRKFVAIFSALAFTIAGAFANNLGTLGVPTFQPLNVSYITAANNNATGNVNTVTFAGTSIGTALGDRYVLVAYHQRNDGGSAPATTSASIGGVSATILAEYAQSTNSTLGFIIAPVPSGTTADITLNFSAATVDSAGIFVYTINQLVRPLNIIGSGTLAATATNPAVVPATNSQGTAVEFYILRVTGNTTNIITPTESGQIGLGGSPTTPCGTGTGNCFSGFAINTGPTSGGVSDDHAASSVGGLTVTLR